MAAVIDGSKAAGDSLKTILRSGLKSLDRNLLQSSNSADSIHRARRRIKSLRAVLRMVRPAIHDDDFHAANTMLRKAGQALASARRVGAMSESAGKLKGNPPTGARMALIREIGKAADRTTDSPMAPELYDAATADAREHLAGLKSLVGQWNFPRQDVELYVDGMTRVFARARRLLEKGLAAGDPGTLHEARKSVIHLRYQLDLLQPAWPPMIEAWGKELQRLREVLGDFNDLCEMERLIRDQEAPFTDLSDRPAALAIVGQRREALIAKGKPLAQRLFAEPPQGFAKRIVAVWKSWCTGA